MNQLSRHIILMLLALTIGQASAQMSLYTTSQNQGNEVLVEIRAKDFLNIAGLQMSLVWDRSDVRFIEVDSMNNGLFPDPIFGPVTEGSLKFIFTAGFIGVSLPDDALLFSARFERLNEGTTEVSIRDLPNFYAEAIEFPPSAQNTYKPAILNSVVPRTGAIVEGHVYLDMNSNCVFDAGDLTAQEMILQVEGNEKFYQISALDGHYSFFLPNDDYDLALNWDSEIWQPCVSTFPVSITSAGDSIYQDFFLQPQTACEKLRVDVVAPEIVRCADNNYDIKYVNIGSAEATDVVVTVHLDPNYTVVSASEAFTMIDATTIQFDVDTVDVYEEGRIALSVSMDCGQIEPGVSHQLEATITPNAFCSAPHPNWTGASLEVNGVCDSDSVRFTVTNTGTANMQTPRSHIIIQDIVGFTGPQIDPSPVLLDMGESRKFSLDANGSTYRMRVEQSPFHPGSSMPSIVVEGCGTNDMGEISKGFATMFPEDDLDVFVSRYRQENIELYASNSQAAVPKGVGMERLVGANTEMKYSISFQNVGIDTTYDVVIVDTLHPLLDVTTLRPGPSSHAYEMSMIENRVLKIAFENIRIPSANSDEIGSRGFVSFFIRPYSDAAHGEIFANDACIFFEQNPVVKINQVMHKIGESMVPITSTTSPLKDQTVVNVFPNPVEGKINIEYLKPNGSGTLYLYDQLGRLVFHAPFRDGLTTLDVDNIYPGIYFYEIRLKQVQSTINGKLIVR